MQQLLSQIRACTACQGLPLGPKPIVQLSPKARILIVGQAPGRITHAKGVPFDDPSGNRLRDWLGLDRQAFYDADKLAIAPMGFCFPGAGKSGDLPPRPECAQLWRAPIHAALPQIETTLVIGRYALAFYLPQHTKLSLSKAAQLWQDSWPDKILLPHPSPRNNRWLKSNPWFEAELVPMIQERVRAIISG